MNNRIKPNLLKRWLELSKFKLSFAVALSPVAGFFMFGYLKALPLLGVFVGTLLLSCAVIALNQYQEKDTDAKMGRTQNRPLPAGYMSEKEALTGIVLLVLLGLLILWLFTNPVTTLLGALNGIWYNFVYTPLKRKTAFAVIPGGLCGAIPPIMGWAAAGGNLLAPKIVVLALFFFVWQVPHFWLILLKYGREYQKAGLASVTSFWTEDQLKNITFIWMMTTGVSAFLLPVFNMVFLLSLKIILVVIATGYLYTTWYALYGNRKKVNYFLAFMGINVFLLLVMIVLVIQQYI